MKTSDIINSPKIAYLTETKDFVFKKEPIALEKVQCFLNSSAVLMKKAIVLMTDERIILIVNSKKTEIDYLFYAREGFKYILNIIKREGGIEPKIKKIIHKPTTKDFSENGILSNIVNAFIQED